jgi:hypothetical protein
LERASSLEIFASTKCDLSLYEVSSKSPKDSVGIVKTNDFSKKQVSPGAVTP